MTLAFCPFFLCRQLEEKAAKGGISAQPARYKLIIAEPSKKTLYIKNIILIFRIIM
jgi:hypothetical protein